MFGTDTNDHPRDGNGSDRTDRLRYRRITFGHKGKYSAQRGTPVRTELPGFPTELPRTHPHNEYSTLNDPLVRTSSRPAATQPPGPLRPRRSVTSEPTTEQGKGYATHDAPSAPQAVLPR